MRYTLTIRQEQYEFLQAAIFSLPGCEGAAFLQCGMSATSDEIRLLVTQVAPVAEHHYLVRESDRLSIDSASYVSAAKQARPRGASVVMVHSHPRGPIGFSAQDDREDPKLIDFLVSRIPKGLHGSIVFTPGHHFKGRIWTSAGWVVVERIRVLGDRFRFLDDDTVGHEEPVPEFFDRQVRAFGPQMQRHLRRFHIGVVGAGGTGSAVIEQLTRLGVGRLSIFDGESLAASNVSRVYGSHAADFGLNKADIAHDHVLNIGLGTEVRRYVKPITDELTAKQLRDCDVVFGCTDKQAPRGLLVQLALRYLIPVVDLGVVIDSPEEEIRGIYGRVTFIMPGEACLFCRRRISPDRIRLESLAPEEQELLADENYAPRLGTPDPAVITFTTTVASYAISEFLHRLTGFMGAEHRSSEILLFFHDNSIKSNRVPSNADCVCAQTELWGKGDGRDYLGLVWPESKDEKDG